MAEILKKNAEVAGVLEEVLQLRSENETISKELVSGFWSFLFRFPNPFLVFLGLGCSFEQALVYSLCYLVDCPLNQVFVLVHN